MGTYFNPFVGRPLEPEHLAGIALVYRQVLDREGIDQNELEAAILASRAIRLYQIGICEHGALLGALVWFRRMTTRSHEHPMQSADRDDKSWTTL